MSRYFWSLLALVSLVATFLNTDTLIPILRGFWHGSAWPLVIVVSVLANAKVALAFFSVGKSGVPQKMGVKHPLLVRFRDWAWQWIRKSEVAAIVVLTITPLPLTRTICTAWCSATQSSRGLVALLLANPIHVWTYVVGLDWILGR